LIPARVASAFTTCQIALGVMLSPRSCPADLLARRSPTVDASRRGPLIDCAFRPHWNRNRTDVLSFANQISDHPVFFANLEVFRSDSNQLCLSQSASDEQRQNRPITFASEAV
jgi:hypothetical protein